MVGYNLRARQVQVEQSAALLAKADQLREEQAKVAALDERARIAREIHDVLAHSLGALGLHIQAAQAVLTRQHDDVNSRGISLSDVAGTVPRSVYYAYDPATDTYWAEANFLPSRTASLKVLVGFQDGASIGLFARAARSGWQVQLGGEPVVCAEVPFFPPAVLIAWSLPTDTAAFGCSVRPVRQTARGSGKAAHGSPATRSAVRILTRS
jgi:hypothetical protein